MLSRQTPLCLKNMQRQMKGIRPSCFYFLPPPIQRSYWSQCCDANSARCSVVASCYPRLLLYSFISCQWNQPRCFLSLKNKCLLWVGKKNAPEPLSHSSKLQKLPLMKCSADQKIVVSGCQQKKNPYPEYSFNEEERTPFTGTN